VVACPVVKTSFDSPVLDELALKLARTNAETARHYPVDDGSRQPVHTVYGGAHLFKAGAAAKLGDIALRTLKEYGGDPVEFARDIELTSDEQLARKVYGRMRDKLEREAVEDFRIDFEDGYGNRADAEEDGHAVAAAKETAAGMKEGSLPPFIGIRIKPLSDDLCRRSLRTLDLYVTTLVGASGGKLPNHFVITLPKITSPEQVGVLVDAVDRLEKALGLPGGVLRIEFMIETPQSILTTDGRCSLPLLLQAARGRCAGAHFGTYDYTALVNITADHQQITHPACDFAKDMMQVSLVGRGVMLSDGATNIMPVPRHRAKDGEKLSEKQVAENRESVIAAWRLHVRHIRHSLIRGYYQGWDLHPAQLPTRYAAVYAFFLEGFTSAAQRLKNFVGQAAQATLVGDVFDDAATGQGLLNYFLRGINCGAFSEEEALATGLTLEEIRTRSFLKILQSRRK
jgi:citrate lyase beta subunit